MAVPTRLIVILSRQSSVITYVLRADVPVGQEAAYATPGAVSPTGDTESLWLHVEPYAMLRPIVRRRYFVAGGVPNTNITPRAAVRIG
jgi:hypothetical protein